MKVKRICISLMRDNSTDGPNKIKIYKTLFRLKCVTLSPVFDKIYYRKKSFNWRRQETFFYNVRWVILRLISWLLINITSGTTLWRNLKKTFVTTILRIILIRKILWNYHQDKNRPFFTWNVMIKRVNCPKEEDLFGLRN